MSLALFSAHSLWWDLVLCPPHPTPSWGIDPTWNVTHRSGFPKVCSLDHLLRNHTDGGKGGGRKEDFFTCSFLGPLHTTLLNQTGQGATVENCILTLWPSWFWYTGQFKNLSKSSPSGVSNSSSFKTLFRRSETTLPKHMLCPETGSHTYATRGNSPGLHFLI